MTRSRLPRPRHHGGFAMVSAIFLMVVLALLGGLMVTMSNTQQISAVRDLLGTRAYYAARAGIEWGTYRVLQGGVPCPFTAALPNAVAATGFSVQVTCSATAGIDEGSTPYSVYQITSTATTGTLGQHDRAERQLQALVGPP